MQRATTTALVLLAAMVLAACGTRRTSSTQGAPGQTGTSTTASGGLTVAPTQGGPSTTFAVSFTAPASSAPVGGSRIGYTVSVTGGTGACLGTRSTSAGAATKGLPVSVPLDPAKLGGEWCAGPHTARVIEIETPICNPGTMCPQYVRVIGTVGEARFTVGA